MPTFCAITPERISRIPSFLFAALPGEPVQRGIL
jgi:hypothetical protein